MKWSLRQKVVVISGAAGGLGAALCRRVLEDGGAVGALDVDAAGLKALRRSIPDGALATETCDLRDEASVRAACERLREALGPIDAVIANAGITHLRNFTSGESAAVRRVMEVNFFGAVHLVDACFHDLVARRGMIVAISSVAGYAPLVGRTAYSASKHALHGFFDTLRCELRSEERKRGRKHGRDGCSVLLVCPSFIATGIRQPSRHHGRGEDDAKDDGHERQALGREGEVGMVGVVGSEDTPEAIADRIIRAMQARRRFLATGRVGHLARLIHRISPRLYEHLMLRRIRHQKP